MLTDDEIRHLAIELLTAPTARDAQVKIGASNLSNGCDFCLASNLLGDNRETPITDRAWGGRVNGTAVHGLLEQRFTHALWLAAESAAQPAEQRRIASALEMVGRRHPDALIEQHLILGTLGSYGDVGTTADLILPMLRTIVDWKGTDKKKLAVLVDAICIGRGEPAPYGRTHKDVKLSVNEYEKKIAEAAEKLNTYYRQVQLYILAARRAGHDIVQGGICFVARDSTMWFDNPGAERYDDPTAAHGVYALTFQYNEPFALETWQRGVTIWEAIEAGATAADFPRHPLCFPCGLDGDIAQPAAAA